MLKKASVAAEPKATQHHFIDSFLMPRRFLGECDCPESTPDSLTTASQVVHHDVLAQLPGRGVESAALINARHLVNEVHQVVVGFEHERVDGYALLRAAFNLFERFV